MVPYSTIKGTFFIFTFWENILYFTFQRDFLSRSCYKSATRFSLHLINYEKMEARK